MKNPEPEPVLRIESDGATLVAERFSDEESSWVDMGISDGGKYASMDLTIADQGRLAAFMARTPEGSDGDRFVASRRNGVWIVLSPWVTTIDGHRHKHHLYPACPGQDSAKHLAAQLNAAGRGR